MARAVAGCALVFVFISLSVLPAKAQETSAIADVPVIRTDSPGEVVASFAQLSAAIEDAVVQYLADATRDRVTHIDLLFANLRYLIDLEEIPAANRHRVGNATVLALLDTFARIDLPDQSDLPSGDSFDDLEVAAVRLAGTPLRIVRIDEGPRAGEWLFEGSSVATAPRFFTGIADKPARPTAEIENWSAVVPQLTGPLVANRFTIAVPTYLRTQWLGLPIWKTLLLVLAGGLSGLIVGRVRVLSRTAIDKEWRGAQVFRLAPSLLAIALVEGFLPSFARELIPFSQMPDGIAFAVSLLSYGAYAWLFWSAVQVLVGLWDRSGGKGGLALDGDRLRVIGVGVGGLGVIVIATTGAQRLGIPVVSLIAGLGIGGLAVALALRPTLENLVGGLLLYLDRPVRIGDFCTFGEQSGTVEHIGVRAVWVRAIDRTMITIPNARFADMELVNWAACDMMLINRTLGLRFETSTDQLRYVLAEIRKVLHAHPRIDDDTIRIRYVGPTESAKQIDLRYYVKTREWNEFFAIREDTLLRIDEVVEAAGARLAVPARVLQVSRDAGGSDPEGRSAAEEEVELWRKTGKLPFPKFSSDELAAMGDTLDYPPHGSPDAGSGGYYQAATPERLSDPAAHDPEEDQER